MLKRLKRVPKKGTWWGRAFHPLRFVLACVLQVLFSVRLGLGCTALLLHVRC